MKFYYVQVCPSFTIFINHYYCIDYNHLPTNRNVQYKMKNRRKVIRKRGGLPF